MIIIFLTMVFPTGRLRINPEQYTLDYGNFIISGIKVREVLTNQNAKTSTKI